MLPIRSLHTWPGNRERRLEEEKGYCCVALLYEYTSEYNDKQTDRQTDIHSQLAVSTRFSPLPKCVVQVFVTLNGYLHNVDDKIDNSLYSISCSV